ncbi:MAG: DNA methyltransferase [Desulfomonilaceae bacterium]
MLYSSDKPNPHLNSFVMGHVWSRPFDPDRDDYVVPEFTSPIKTTKNSPIYSMHSYHLGKKPHDAVEAYIKHYTSAGDLVLDPFCGSGSTALAALLQGRKAVAIDASPAATFITRFYISRSDPTDLADRFQRMCNDVSGEMRYLYGTICHHCNSPATIHHVIYSNVYVCPSCSRRVSLYEAARHTPPCCPWCLSERGFVQPISPFLRTHGYEPVAVNFSCHGACRPKRMTRSILGSAKDREAFQGTDVPRIRKIEAAPVPHPYPDRFMMDVADPNIPWGDEWRPSRNFRRVADLFTRRNLRAVAAFMQAAGSDEDLRAIITSGMFAVSRKAQHLAEGGGYVPGNWALPPMSKQRNCMESLSRVFARILTAKKILNTRLQSQDACISTQSATSLAQIPSDSVDYIFTDPPYGGTVQYGELNFIWESWLGLNTEWHDQEIVVNRTRGKSLRNWAEMMFLAIKECYRVLKPGRCLSLCWHDASASTWRHLQNIMGGAGFTVEESDRALCIDTGSNTYNQRVTDKVVKRDLVINFRKPRQKEKSRAATAIGKASTPFHIRARVIITNYLKAHPGSPKDRIYDHLMCKLIRSGPVEDHDFEKLLSRVARRAGDGRNAWFLM